MTDSPPFRLSASPEYYAAGEGVKPDAPLTSVHRVGYFATIYLAGLHSIDRTFYEAARIDGAGAWGCFRRITLPLLRPTTLFVVVVSVILSFQVFALVYVMTRGGPAGATSVVVSTSISRPLPTSGWVTPAPSATCCSES